MKGGGDIIIMRRRRSKGQPPDEARPRPAAAPYGLGAGGCQRPRPRKCDSDGGFSPSGRNSDSSSSEDGWLATRCSAQNNMAQFWHGPPGLGSPGRVPARRRSGYLPPRPPPVAPAHGTHPAASCASLIVVVLLCGDVYREIVLALIIALLDPFTTL